MSSRALSAQSGEEKRQDEQTNSKINDAASLPCRVLFISGEEAAVPSSRMLALARALTRQGMRVILATPSETESWPLEANGKADPIQDLHVTALARGEEGADEEGDGGSQAGKRARKETQGAIPGVFVPTHSQTPWARAETLRTLKALIKREDIGILHSFGAYAAEIAAVLKHCGNKRQDANGRWFRPALVHIAQGDDALLAELANQEALAAGKDAIFSQSLRPDAFFATGSRERNELIDRWHQPAQSVFLSLEGIDTLQYAPKQDVLKDFFKKTDEEAGEEIVQDAGEEVGEEAAKDAAKETGKEKEEAAKEIREEAGEEKEYILSTANCLTVDMTQNGNLPAEVLPALRRQDKQDKVGARILCAACLREEEAYTPFLLLDLIGSFKKSVGASLTLLGDGPLFEKMAAKVKAVNEQYGCTAVLLPEGDLATLAAQHDIFVGSGRAALSALAAGLPVILSDNRGMIDFFSPSSQKEASAKVTCASDKSGGQTAGASAGSSTGTSAGTSLGASLGASVGTSAGSGTDTSAGTSTSANADASAFTPRFLALSRQGFRPVGAPLATRERMKEALCALFNADPPTLIAFGREGRAFVEAHHSLAKEAADCAALYRRLLSARLCKYPKTLVVAPDCRRPGALSALEGLVRTLLTPSATALASTSTSAGMSACASAGVSAGASAGVCAGMSAGISACASAPKESPVRTDKPETTREESAREETDLSAEAKAQPAACLTKPSDGWEKAPSLCEKGVEEAFFQNGELAIWGDPSLASFFPGIRVIPRGFSFSLLPLFLSLRRVVAAPGVTGQTCDGKILHLAAKMKKPIAYWGLATEELTRPTKTDALFTLMRRLPGKQKTLVFSSLTPPEDERALAIHEGVEALGRADKEKISLRFAPPPALFLPPWEEARGLRREEEKRPFCLFLLDLSPWGPVTVPDEGTKPTEKTRKASFYFGTSSKEAPDAPIFGESGLVPYTAPVFQPDWRENSPGERKNESTDGSKNNRKIAGKDAGGKTPLPVIHTVYPLRAFFEKNRKGREEGIAFFAKLALFASELGFRPLFLLPNGEESDERLKALVLAIVTRCEKAGESAFAPVIRLAAPREQAALAKEAAFTVTTYEDGLWHAAAAGTPLLYLSAAPKARATVAALPSAALLSPFCHAQSAAIGSKEKRKAGKRPARPTPPKRLVWDSAQGLSDAKEAVFALLSLGRENKEAGLKTMRAQKEAFVSAAKAVRADFAFFDCQRALAKRRRKRKKKERGTASGLAPSAVQKPVRGTIPGTIPSALPGATSGKIPGTVPGTIPGSKAAQEGTP